MSKNKPEREKKKKPSSDSKKEEATYKTPTSDRPTPKVEEEKHPEDAWAEHCAAKVLNPETGLPINQVGTTIHHGRQNPPQIQK